MMFEDILRESWVFQDILAEGLEKGIQQGIQQGVQQGIQQGIQQGLEKGHAEERSEELQLLVQEQYPGLADLIAEHKERLIALPQFRTLYIKIIRTDNEEQARQIIQAAIQN